MHSFAQVIRNFDPSVAFTSPPDWLQGRTVYGGLSVALALQTALLRWGDGLPPLKSALVSFVGPATEELWFEPRVLRRGKSATFVAVDGLVGNDVFLRVEFVFAAARPSRIEHDFHAMPNVAAPGDYAGLRPSPDTPASVGNFDLRPAGGALPQSGAGHPEVVAWIRHLDAEGVDPAVSLLAVADGLPPAVITALTERAAFSSMTWTIDLATPATVHDWYLMRSTSTHARGGYSSQSMEIWDEVGKLILTGSQTVAVFA